MSNSKCYQKTILRGYISSPHHGVSVGTSVNHRASRKNFIGFKPTIDEVSSGTHDVVLTILRRDMHSDPYRYTYIHIYICILRKLNQLVWVCIHAVKQQNSWCICIFNGGRYYSPSSGETVLKRISSSDVLCKAWLNLTIFILWAVAKTDSSSNTSCYSCKAEVQKSIAICVSNSLRSTIDR